MNSLTVTQTHFLLTGCGDPCACELCGSAIELGDRLLMVPAWRTMLPVCLPCAFANRWAVEEGR